jgi:hypothetical protein
MDVVNISRSRRFLRERPIHVNLFDRPRLVVDLLCLEGPQEESRTAFEKSDSLLVLLEGEARLRAGPQIESLQEMDAVLVPPGQEYTVTNTGAGQMLALVMLTPKPTRADEVRLPGDHRPFRTVRPDRDENGNGERYQARPSFREGDNAPRERSFTSRDDRPRRDRPSYPRRDEGGPRPSYPRRDDSGARPAYPRRDEGGPRDSYPRRDDNASRGGSYPRRDGAPSRPPYPRREGSWNGPRRNEGGSSDRPNFDRPRPFRRDVSSEDQEQGRPRRGNTGARPPRGGEGEGPVWYPKPKPAWRPFGAPPAARGRGKPAGNRDEGGEGRRGNTGGYRGGGAPRGASGGPGRSGGSDARGGSSSRGGGGFGRQSAPRGGGNGRKTGDARRASRGQGPLNGHRGPGRNEPRT